MPETQTKEDLEASRNNLDPNMTIILPQFKDPEKEKKND